MLVRLLALGVLIAGLTVAVAGVWFVAAHRASASTSLQAAEAEFAQIRSRFVDQQPLLNMNARAASDVRGRSGAPLRTFHTVVFDTRGGQRIVRISVPYWFAPGGGQFISWVD